jgi:tetratricopeptide (TPR) repeat protein
MTTDMGNDFMKYLTIFVLLIFAESAAMGMDSDDSLVGKKFMIMSWHAKLMDNGKELDTPVSFGDIFTVDKVDGHLLRIKSGWIDESLVMPPDKAIESLNEKISADQLNGSLYHDRAAAYLCLRDIDKALEDQNHSLALYALSPPRNLAIGYNGRGLIWLRKGDVDAAIRDFTKAIEYQSDYESAFNNRGLAYRTAGNYEAALNDFEQSIRINPKFSNPYGNRAWIWATCPDPKYRDGPKAVESATRACELTSWRSASRLDDLAAAYAEQGDFKTAAEWEAKTLDLEWESYCYKDPKYLSTRLDLYMQDKPFRDQPKTEGEKSQAATKDSNPAANSDQ